MPRSVKRAVAAAVAMMLAVGVFAPTAASADELPTMTMAQPGIYGSSQAISPQFSYWTDANGLYVSGVTNSFQWMRNSVPIPGATTQTYQLTADDSDETMSVAITGHRDGYADSTVTSFDFAVAPTPIKAGRVRIQSTTPDQRTVFGTVLSATIPAFTPADVDVSLQWLRDGDAIAGATGSTYTLTVDDASSNISVVATGSKGRFASASSTSSSFRGPSLLEDVGARLAGSATVGSTLTAVASGLMNPGVTTLSYSWSDGKSVLGTAATYTPKLADVGQRIRATITASTSKGSVSRPTVSLLVTPTIPKAPKAAIAGKAKVGATLTAKPGTWSPGVMKFTYQWYAGNLPIPGAVKAKLHVGKAQAGKRVVVRITGTHVGYRGFVTISSPTKRVGK